MDPIDAPPARSLADLSAALERGLADVAAGRTIPGEVVMARLDASIAAMEAKQAKANDAA